MSRRDRLRWRLPRQRSGGGVAADLPGDNTCCACHGLALVITVRAGDGDEHTVLFDGGPAGYAVRHNGERLATDPGVRFEPRILDDPSHRHGRNGSEEAWGTR